MALLFRTCNHGDSTETQTFAFILPPAVAREDCPSEIMSRDILYRGLKFRANFVRNDRHIGPYLQWTSATEGFHCSLDFSFTLINRASFSSNEQCDERQKIFSMAEPRHGRRTFVTIDDLNGRNFTDDRGEFLIELSLKNMKCWFEQLLPVNLGRRPSGSKSNSGSKAAAEIRDYQRYDTWKFLMGDLEFQAVFCPNMDLTDSGVQRHLIQINRITKCDTLCRIRYQITIGLRGKKSLTSEICDEIFDFNGTGVGWYFMEDYLKFAKNGQLPIRIDVFELTYINEFTLDIKQPKASATFKDKDRQGWSLQFVPNDENLILRLIYSDIFNVPSNYFRYVLCSVRILIVFPRIQLSAIFWISKKVFRF